MLPILRKYYVHGKKNKKAAHPMQLLKITRCDIVRIFIEEESAKM